MTFVPNLPTKTFGDGLPSIPDWIPPLDTGQTSASDLNDLSNRPKQLFAARNSVISILYGRDRVFGKPFVVTIDDTTGFLYVAYSICEGEIGGYETIFVDSSDVILDGTAYFGLKNRGFESGTFDNWTTGGGSIESDLVDSGAFAATVPSSAGGPNLLSDFYPCAAEGTVYRVSGSMARDPNDLPDANADIAIRWYDSGGSPVGTRDSGTAPTGFTNLADYTVAGWQALVTEVTVPAGATQMRFDFGESVGTTGFWYCDTADYTVLLGNNPTLTTDPIELVVYRGAAGQVVDSLLSNALVGYEDTLDGLAYIVARVPRGATSGFPRLEAIVQGRKIYDPRLDSTRTDILPNGSGAHRENDSTTWEYSSNPTICFRDLIFSYTGWSISDQGLVELADYNDEDIGGGVLRRTIGLTLTNPAEIEKWVGAFRTYMGGFVGWDGGSVVVVPNKADVDAQRGVLLDSTAGTWVNVGDQIELDVGTSDFTLEASFIAPESSVTNKAIAGKILSETVLGAGYVIYMNTSGHIVARVDDGTNAVTISSSPTQYDDSVFHHVAMVVDQTGNTMDLIIDDVVAATQVSIATVTGTLSNAEPFRIGALGNAGALYDGTIDEVRLWDDVRNSTELAANRLQEIADPTSEPNLVGYWKLNDLSGTTASDASSSANDGTLGGNAVFGLGNPQIIPDGVAMHITPDDIVKDSLVLSRRTLRNTPNSVAIEYEDASGSRWTTERVQADSPRVVSGAEKRRLSRVGLPGIHNATQAQREATERLNWYLTDLEATLSLFDEGWQLQTGSIIALTHPLGLDAKLMRVLRLTGQSGRWTIDLAEYDPAVYSNEIVVDPTTPDTNLGNPLSPPTVSGLSLAEELFTYKNGNTGSRVRITFNRSRYPFLSQYRVEGLVEGVVVWHTETQGNEVVTPGVEELVTTAAVAYEVNVYIQSPFAQGSPANDTVTIQGKLAPPSDVPSLEVIQTSADTVELNWGAAIDIDIWRYEIRRGSASSTWSTATDITSTLLIDGLSTTRTGVPVGTYRYHVKARDSVGNESVNSRFASITLAEPAPATSLSGFEVASEVRLAWNAPVAGFTERFRVAYDTIPPSNEVTLDIVDTLRFQTKDVPEGTWRFLVYAQDKNGVEATTAPSIDIEVTSDADAFLADTYDFVTPGLTNMHEYNLRLDAEGRKIYVTNMGDVFSSSPSDFNDFSAEALANYHSSGNSQWLSETHDFGLLLTGSWNLTHNATALSGSISVTLELSPDNATYTNFQGAAKGEYRYARVRITTATTSTAFVTTPLMSLKINVVPLEESGEGVTSPTVGKTINLAREYTALKEVNAQPKNKTDALMAIVDNIVVGSNTGISFDGTSRLSTPDNAVHDFGTGDFTLELWAKNTINDVGVMVAKRAGSSTIGWELVSLGSSDLRFTIDDDVAAQVNVDTSTDVFPQDGQWHHIGVTVNRSTDLCKIRVDEVEAASVSIATVTGTISNAIALTIGDRTTTSDAWIGDIDEVRLWSDVRSDAEIDDNASIALDMTVTNANLVGYWSLDGPVGDTVVTTPDSTVNAATMTETGAGVLTYVDPGSSGNLVQKINSFDVYVFDIFGQQLAEQFQYNWKAV